MSQQLNAFSTRKKIEIEIYKIWREKFKRKNRGKNSKKQNFAGKIQIKKFRAFFHFLFIFHMNKNKHFNDYLILSRHTHNSCRIMILKNFKINFTIFWLFFFLIIRRIFLMINPQFFTLFWTMFIINSALWWV